MKEETKQNILDSWAQGANLKKVIIKYSFGIKDPGLVLVDSFEIYDNEM